MTRIHDLLKGGDLRSTGAADKVAREAEDNPSVVVELVAGLRINDSVIRMRCADALEKVTRNHSEYLSPYAQELLGLLSPDQPKELLWHLIQMVPRVNWSSNEISNVVASIRMCLSNSSSIVKVNAMQALFELTKQAPEKTNEIKRLLTKLSRTGTPAMRARGAKLLRQVDS